MILKHQTVWFGQTAIKIYWFTCGIFFLFYNRTLSIVLFSKPLYFQQLFWKNSTYIQQQVFLIWSNCSINHFLPLTFIVKWLSNIYFYSIKIEVKFIFLDFVSLYVFKIAHFIFFCLRCNRILLSYINVSFYKHLTPFIDLAFFVAFAWSQLQCWFITIDQISSHTMEKTTGIPFISWKKQQQQQNINQCMKFLPPPALSYVQDTM